MALAACRAGAEAMANPAVVKTILMARTDKKRRNLDFAIGRGSACCSIPAAEDQSLEHLQFVAVLYSKHRNLEPTHHC